jgi:hypothetical protein
MFLSRAILALLPAVVLAQAPRLTPEEHQQVLDTIHQLVRATNARDAALIESICQRNLYATGDGFVIGMKGLLPWSRQADFTRTQVAALVRDISKVTDDVIVADGFFRTSQLPIGDTAGDFSSTLVKTDGKWRVATVRFAPQRFQLGAHYPVVASPYRTPAEKDAWVTLFDGRSLSAFVAPDGGPVPPSWSIENGTLKLTPPVDKTVPGQGVGIRTRETFRSFELEWEWKLAAKGNSGLKYLLYYLGAGDATAFEYQLVDDNGDPGAIKNAFERSGALYRQIAPSKWMAKPIGEFNQSRLVVRGRHVEHWLNGAKVIEYEADTDPWDSPVLLQNHGNPVWFRNIRVRRLD